jgi:peroxiredoxin
LQEIYKRYANKDVVVIGVNVGENENPLIKARQFRDTYRLTYPILIDQNSALMRFFTKPNGKISLPTNVIFDKEGKQYLQTGADSDAIVRALNRLIAGR